MSRQDSTIKDAPAGDLSQDELDMRKLGKVQQFTRHFGFWSILGFACVAMVTWEGLLITFVYGLENGGPAGLVYGYVFVWLGYAFAIASLAEMMSMWPTSGGQYHWTYTLSPPAWAPFLSYICGWQSVIAWQAGTASATYLGATMIQGLVVLSHTDTYVFQRWHGTLIMYGMMAVVVAFGITCNKFLPYVDHMSLIIHVTGFIILIVAIGVLAPTTASSSDVFEVWLNNGYSSQGLSFLGGLQGIMFAWIGGDGPIHMAEEIQDASRVVPWSLMSGILLNGTMGFGVLLAVLYWGPVGPDLTEALDSPTGYPFMAIFEDVGGSEAAGIGLSMLVEIMVFPALLMIYTAATRELWAFARDKGVPGSRWLSRVDGRSKLPLYCYAVTALVTILLALINIGSAVAFNAIISLTIAGYIGSYAFPIGLLLWRRVLAATGRGPQLPWGPWRLGKFGMAVNGIALAWITVVFVFSFFPVEPLPQLAVQTMNWSSLAYGAITLFAVAFWFGGGRKSYQGPVRDAAGGAIEVVMGWNEGQTRQ